MAENISLPLDGKQNKTWWETITTFRWNAATPELARQYERQVFEHSGATCTAQDTRIGPGPEDVMHSVSAGTSGHHIVCMPGYGAATGFYYRNIKSLASRAQVHLVDWLGTGLSGRPEFDCRDQKETEAWFVDSLQKWRDERGIDTFVLVGHSLGGYLAANYALRHPEHVEHLILVCPAGMAQIPDDWEAPSAVQSPWTMRGQYYRFAKLAWGFGVTPGVVVRTLGPWGRSLTKGYTSVNGRLFLRDEEAACFEPYLHQCLASRGSGEFALRHLLNPFAWAVSPMENRMNDLRVPVTFIYGERDWMNPEAAERICQTLQAQPEPRVAANNDCKVITIPESGHFTFMDQPSLFNKHMQDTLAYLQGTSRTVGADDTTTTHHGPLLDENNAGTTPEVIEEAFWGS